ncbi:MAG: hypothetical protein ACOYOK_13260 [Pseudobdellovibrionaceae bacterium]
MPSINLKSLIANVSNNPQVKELLSTLNRSEQKFHVEVNKALTSAKKSVSDLEKNLLVYKKRLVKQKSEIEKLVRKKLHATSAVKKTTKKSAVRKPRTATKKTTTKKSN